MSSRRDEIVAIARGIFSSKGYRNTSMRDIADACGLLAGSLYSHFKSKSEILQLIIDPFYDELIPAQEEAAATVGTGAERTEEMLRRTFRVLASRSEEMTIIHYDWQDLLDVEEFAGIRERSNYALELWHQVIVAGIEDGTLRPEIDPELTVRVITSSLHGILDPKRYGARPNLLQGERLDGLVDEFVLLMVAGLRSDDAGVTTSTRAKKPRPTGARTATSTTAATPKARSPKGRRST
jgi:TetR/AcrR family transcriptional regulator, cholesterol catabolism regulator